MLNHAVLMGRLTANPELRYTTSNIPVVSFTLAVNRNFSKNAAQTADFIDIVAWRQQAEFVSKYFTKGQLVAVEGAIQTRTYTDKNGNNRKAFEIVADRVHFAESKGAHAAASQASGFTPDSPYQPSEPAAQAAPVFGGAQQAPQVFENGDFGDFEELSSDDDDLPF